MFLTQTEGEAFFNNNKQKRKISLSFNKTIQRSKSAFQHKFSKLQSLHTQFNFGFTKKVSQLKKTLNLTQFNRPLTSVNPEKKWNKIVDLYNMPNRQTDSQQNQMKPIRPGIGFYRLLASQIIFNKSRIKINFPETFLEFSGDLILLSTNRISGELQVQKIQRQKYCAKMVDILEQKINEIKQNPKKYKPHYDFRQNAHAPVIVTKVAQQFDNNFDVDVQSYKNFDQRRSKPSSNKVIQRFIYPRSMQATILRICYHRKKLGQQRQQFFAYRFQNVDNIFRVNKKNNEIFQTFKLQSTISITYDRENKIEFCKLSNMKGIEKYITPSKELIHFLQKSQKIKINKIYIDFIIDLFDTPWLVNLKQILYEQNKALTHNYSTVGNCHALHIAGSYGVCRLCSNQYLKKQLRQSISNKMLMQFLSHLRKRTNITEYDKIQFIKDIIQTKTKNYITLQVCKLCYQIVAEQYKLIEQQQKLAKICNIFPQIQMLQPSSKPLNLPNQLKQWRFMIYFVGISNIPSTLLRGQEQVQLKYRLGNTDDIQFSWPLKVCEKMSSNNFHGNYQVQIVIKKVKIHYFYSQSLDIDHFLKQTQINFQLAALPQQRVFAKGSSGTLSTFRRQFHKDLCLRQTSSVLLFYNNGKYCEMTIKVGLICDGLYQSPDNTSLIPLNKVHFADCQFSNFNPIPREWMQAFGVSQQMLMMQQIQDQNINQVEDDIIKHNNGNKTKQNKCRNKLSRKSLNLYR